MNDARRVTAHPLLDQNNVWEEEDVLRINVRAIVARLWRGKFIILASMLICGTFGYMTSSRYDPQYRASAMVMFDIEGTEAPDVEAILSGAQITDTNLQNQIEVLRSKTLIEKVIAQLLLDESPEFNPSLVPVEPSLRDIVAERITVPPEITAFVQQYGLIPTTEPEPEPNAQLVRARQERIVIGNVLSRLELSPVPQSRVIEIAFTSTDPQTAAEVVNSIAEQFIVDQLEAKLEATRAASEWLAIRVGQLRDRLDEAEEAVDVARARQVTASSRSLEVTNRQLIALSADVAVARTVTQTAEATYKRLQGAAQAGNDFGSVPEFRASRPVAELLTAESTLLVDLEIARQTVGRPLREIQQVEIQLQSTRARIAEEVMRIAEAARLDWQDKLARQSALETEISSLDSLAIQQAGFESTIRTLERNEQASRLLYENFIRRLDETSQEEELTSADARILSAADPPLSAERQAQNRTQLISLLFGAALGTGLIFLIESFRSTFRSAPEIEKFTGMSVLGSIPSAGRRLRRSTVLHKFKSKPKSRLAEAVRNLRTSILFSNGDTPPQVVMFTSSSPREGKSVTASLIALTSHQMGKSTIVVDCDLRRPAIAKILQSDETNAGLMAAIEGALPVEECIHKDVDTGLHVLMSDPRRSRVELNAADLLSSEGFNSVMQNLRERYDLIVLDAPPVLSIADARITATHADAVVYVVRWATTLRGMVLDGLRDLHRIGAPVVGVAMTVVNERKAEKNAYFANGYHRTNRRSYYAN